MTDSIYSYADLAAKAEELKAMLPAGDEPAMPKKDLSEALETIGQLIDRLQQVCPVPEKLRKDVLKNPVSKRIVKLTDEHPEVFDEKYFATRYRKCPCARSPVADEPKAREDARDRLICYHYLSSRTRGREKLKQLLEELQRVPIDKKEALRHHVSLQILRFTKERSRKSFFSPDYFERKLRELPAATVRPSGIKIEDFQDPREALICSVYFGSPQERREAAIERLQTEIEADFNSDPEVRRVKWMEDLCVDLMIRDNQKEIAQELAKKVPKPQDIKDFARVNCLKMPRTKKNAKTYDYLWQGLAEEVHNKGALARMKVR